MQRGRPRPAFVPVTPNLLSPQNSSSEVDDAPRGRGRRHHHSSSDNDDTASLGSALMTSGALTPSHAQQSSPALGAKAIRDALEDFRPSVCQDVAMAVREEVLAVLREEFLRPIRQELMQSRDAMLQALRAPQDGSFTKTLEEWASRWDTKLTRLESSFRQEEQGMEKEMQALGGRLEASWAKVESHLLEHKARDCGEVKQLGLPSVGGGKSSVHAGIQSKQSSPGLVVNQLAQILEQQKALDQSLKRLLQEKTGVVASVQCAPTVGDDEAYSSEGKGGKDVGDAGSFSFRSGLGPPRLRSPEAGALAQSGSEASGATPTTRKSHSRPLGSVEFGAEADKWQTNREEQLNAKLNKSSSKLFARVAKHFPEAAPDTALSRFVQHSHFFNNSATALILLNTVFIGAETDVGMQCAVAGTELPAYFALINRIFMIAFCIELAIRLTALQSWWLFGPDCRWNLFDATLVGLGIFQEIMAGANVGFVRVFRLFRIIRVARIIRVVRFFRELRRMICAIVSCLASLAWAFLLLVLIMYVFSIFFVQGASGWITENPSNAAGRAEIMYWYSSIPTTMFSLLVAISGGYDWWSILEPLVQVSEMYRLVFTFFIVFVVFGVLNVLTGVFLESSTEFLDKDLVIQSQMMRADMFVQEMNIFFKEFDTLGHGIVTWERFEEVLENEEVVAYLASHQLDCQDAYTLFQLLDREGQDQISIHEFIHGCLRLKGQARSIDTACLAREVGLIKTLVTVQMTGILDALADLRADVGPPATPRARV